MMKKYLRMFSYYLGSSYHRRRLDELQEQFQHVYRGTVLDIGGRDRGLFQKPKSRVNRWIFADIRTEHQPDIILDVVNMCSIANSSCDVVNAIELFEHIAKPEVAIEECSRVLKKDGHMVISMPFMFPVHGDPGDYQRWTLLRWEAVLESAGLHIEHSIVIGKYFHLLGDMWKRFVKGSPFLLRPILYVFHPVMDLIVSLDRLDLIIDRLGLHGYDTGYFFVCRK